MKDVISRLNARYGDDWFTFQPPGARPIRITENTGLQLGIPIFMCRAATKTNEVLVMESYSLKLVGTVTNPYWAGHNVQPGCF